MSLTNLAAAQILLTSVNNTPNQQFISVDKQVMQKVLTDLVMFIKARDMTEEKRIFFVQELTMHFAAIWFADWIERIALDADACEHEVAIVNKIVAGLRETAAQNNLKIMGMQ